MSQRPWCPLVAGLALAACAKVPDDAILARAAEHLEARAYVAVFETLEDLAHPADHAAEVARLRVLAFSGVGLEEDALALVRATPGLSLEDHLRAVDDLARHRSEHALDVIALARARFPAHADELDALVASTHRRVWSPPQHVLDELGRLHFDSSTARTHAAERDR